MPLPWQLADVSKLEPAIAAAKRAGASKNLVAAAEVRLQEANPMYPRLQPYVSRLQPYVSQAATLCIPGKLVLSLVKRDASKSWWDEPEHQPYLYH